VRLSLYFLVGCGLVFWLGSLVFDLTARSVITRIPPEWEVKFGEDQMKKVRKVLTFEDDTNLVADLTVLAAPLMKTIPAGKVGFRFYVVDWRLPNAFALPGGHILVTSGLLEMADRPEQVLGVVAHEVAHVTQKHSFRQMISGGGPVLILKILLSDRNNNLNLLARRSGLLIYQTYSQQFELEADRMAWDYMVGANLDPHAMIEMLQMLKLFAPGDPRTDPFSSHPALDKRIAWLEEQWDKLPRKSGFVALTNQASAGPGRVMDPRLGRLFRKP
jgi:beta-barrel assembly-enhancing protease